VLMDSTATQTATSQSTRQTPTPDKENDMFALLKDVPVINHPVFRIVLGAAMIAAGLVLHQYILAAVGGFLVVMGVVRGYSVLTSRTQKGQPR